MKSTYPVTPDGRYFVVRDRLWRCTNPLLSADAKKVLVDRLMQARRSKGSAIRAGNKPAIEDARRVVDEVKQQLGERGAAWWTDGEPDWNRHKIANTPYAQWYSHLSI